MAERADSCESDIQEGFFCPICKADLKSFNSLKKHFEENHLGDQDSKGLNVVELFEKATKKILKIDNSLSDSKKSSVEYETEIQEIGYIRSHSQQFKNARCRYLEPFATETNKLIIRLDQLLLVDNSDRRQHEQNVVHWLDGSSVKLCPQCAKSFNLTRRQHHCRLCGTLMCHACTLFLSLSAARSIISGVHDSNAPKIVDETDSLRICSHCMNMLDYRKRVQLNRTSRPVICELYDRLRTVKNNIDPNVEMYKKMYVSLHAGEQTYKLADAQTLRGSIAKQGEILDAISKKISSIPLNPDIPRAVTLQNAIRRSTSNYIKDTLLSLPPLPSLSELLEKQRRHQGSIPQTVLRTSTKPKVMTDGWSPVVADKAVQETEDAFLQQIEIVRGYIVQARKDLRFEEVASLEKHLKELQIAYDEQKILESSNTSNENT